MPERAWFLTAVFVPAEGFFDHFFNYFSLNHRVDLEQLHTVTAPHHVHQHELARRFRSEKYVIRMSKSGKELLLGWLMDGTGGEPMGAGLGMGGEEYTKKGRVAVMSVLNNRMDIQGNTLLILITSC
jgi:transcription initiation factor TFIID subunit 5